MAKLYHLAEDPQEMKDLSADPAMVHHKKALFAKFRALQKRYDDQLPLDTVFPAMTPV